MDHRSIVAIALCILFYLGYTQYLAKKYPKQPAAETTTEEPAKTPPPHAAAPTGANSAAAAAPSTGAAASIKRLSADELHLASDKVIYDFSQDLGGPASLTLVDYKSNNKAGAEPVNLLDAPLALQATTATQPEAPFTGPFQAERQGRAIKFWRDAGDFRLTQEFTIPDTGFGADLKVSFTNISTKPVELVGGLLLAETVHAQKVASMFGLSMGSRQPRDQIIYKADGSTEWIDVEKFCKGDKDPPSLTGVPINYLGIDRHYFLSVVEPKAKNGSLLMAHDAADGDGTCQVRVLNFDKQGLIQPNATVTLEYGLFTGPKDLPFLEAHNPELSSAMHLGVFSFIARPLLGAIDGFNQVTHNYGLAIILLTICLKLLFFPLMRASSTSMHRMKKLNPQMQLIRDKYKDDKAKQQQEIMKFMAAHKINPAKGCLPVLPQIPVFFAFYQVLQNAIQLRHAPFFGWIHDLAAMDPYYVTPLLMGVAMFLQQKLTPTTGMDKTQEKIMMFMPLMFTFMMLSLPAGLTLYMLTNTLIGIAQQKWLYKRLERLEPNPV